MSGRNIVMGKKRHRRWIPLLIVIVAVLLAGLTLSGSASYVLVYPKSKAAFRESRPGAVGSYEFISRGVTFGMNSDEVAERMKGAYQAFAGTREDEPVTVYLFRYGPPWRKPFSATDRYVYEEWYKVYYDTRGQAVRLERRMVAGPGQNARVDLRTRQLERE